MAYGVHKDDDPRVTVRRVEEALAELGICVRVTDAHAFGEANHSVRLEDTDMPMIRSNGKGVTPDFALASCYAEFLERLQNGHLYSHRFGSRPEPRFLYPDETELDVSDALGDGPDPLLAWFWRRGLGELHGDRGTIRCVPYFNVWEGTVHFAPALAMRLSCGSNGMCAGNTPEEAICQGICEVLERETQRQMLRTAFDDLRTIPLAYVKNFKVYDLVEETLRHGYHVVIKDLSFGGRFPVVALILLDQSRTRFQINVASDILLETAIQRTFTEIAQGFDATSLVFRMHSLPLDEYRLPPFMKGLTEYARNVSAREPGVAEQKVIPRAPLVYEGAYLRKFVDHRQSLGFLLKTLRRQRLPLYVRDVSFLGFSSYHVFVPGFSGFPGWPRQYANTPRMAEIAPHLLALRSADDEDLQHIAELLDYETGEVGRFVASNPLAKYTDTLRSTESSVLVRTSTGFNALPFRAVLGLIYGRIGDSARACRCFQTLLAALAGPDRYAETTEELHRERSDHRTLECIARYYTLAAESIPQDTIAQTIQSEFGETVARPLLQKLSDKDQIMTLFDLPHCIAHEHCTLCPLANDCVYDDWRRRIECINEKMRQRFPEQQAIEHVFTRVR